MRPLVLAAALILTVWASPGFAADRFTSVAIGDDTANDCLTAATPCRTLGHAVASAASGDTIKVGAGRYHENVTLSTPTILALSGGWAPDFTFHDPTTFRSLIDGGKIAPVLSVVAAGVAIDLTLDGFTLQRGLGGPSACSVDAESGSEGGGINAEASGAGTLILQLSNLVVLRNAALSGGGLAACARTAGVLILELKDSLLTRNKSTKTSPAGGGGIRLRGSADASVDVLIQRVSLVRNRAIGSGGGLSVDPAVSSGQVQVLDSTFMANHAREGYGGGLFLYCPAPASCPLAAVNSVFARNHASTGGAVEVIAPGVGFPVFTNVTAMGNRAPRRPDNVGGIGAWHAKVTNSVLWGNRPGDLGAIGDVDLDHTDVGDILLTGGSVNDLGGNLSVDPLFVSTTDPHLQAGSPVRDAAVCASGPPADFEGDPRPTGAGCDMGADEVFP